MSKAQRAIVSIAGVMMLLFAFGESEGYDANHALATIQFLIAMGLFYWAARPTK